MTLDCCALTPCSYCPVYRPYCDIVKPTKWPNSSQDGFAHAHLIDLWTTLVLHWLRIRFLLGFRSCVLAMRRRSDPSASPREDRPPQQPESDLAFTQRKLEGNYISLYERLDQWRSAIQAGQEVLVWRRPVHTAVLYLAVHTIF